MNYLHIWCLTIGLCCVLQYPRIDAQDYRLDRHAKSALHFETPELSANFDRMLAYHNNNDLRRIYLSASDTIYQLKLANNLSNLSLEASFRNSNSNTQNASTRYRIKALIYDSKHHKLISCASDATCRIHESSNVSIVLPHTDRLINSNNITTNSTTETTNATKTYATSWIAFIGAGPFPHNRVLYLAASSEPDSHLSNPDIPAISSRQLPLNYLSNFTNNDQLFALAFDNGSNSSGTRIHVNRHLRSRFPLRYVYGFQSRGFAYFVSVQKRSVPLRRPESNHTERRMNEDAQEFVTKLVRVCQNDPDYYSYTEIPLSCADNNDNGYSIAEAAFVGKAGSELLRSLGLMDSFAKKRYRANFDPDRDQENSGADDDDAILYVAFSKQPESGQQFRQNRTNESNIKSAICVYPLDYLRKQFTRNIQHCYDGSGRYGLAYVGARQRCIRANSIQISDNFCGAQMNQPLAGEIAAEAIPIMTYEDERLTAIVATDKYDLSIIFAGTASGKIKKIIINQPIAYEFNEISISTNSSNPILSDIYLDGNLLYALTERRFAIIDVRDTICASATNVNDCDRRQTPAYGCQWCVQGNRCTHLTGPSACRRTSPRIDHTNRQATFPPRIGLPTVTNTSIINDIADENNNNNNEKNDNEKNDKERNGSRTRMPGIAALLDNRTDFRANQIFIASGRYHQVKIPVENVFEHSFNVRCRFSFVHASSSNGNDNHKMSQSSFATVIVGGKLDSDFVRCEPYRFEIRERAIAQQAIKMDVLFGETVIQNPNDVHLQIYDCARLADSCGRCLLLDSPTYDCGWCVNTCATEDQCAQQKSTFLDRSQTCPLPRITRFYPTSGPIGGTILTIDGVDLGRQFSDIADGVQLWIVKDASHYGSDEEDLTKFGKRVQCEPLPERYVPTRSIKCRIPSIAPILDTIRPQHRLSSSSSASSASSPIKARIVVKVKNRFIAISENVYRFVG